MVATTAAPVKAGEAVLKWIVKEGGFVHKDLEVLEGEAGSGELSLFSTGIIAKEEALLVIPQKCLIKYSGNELDMCDAGRKLAAQLELGSKSPQHAPYIEYLEATKDNHLLPSGWSFRGKHILLKLLADNFKQVLPTKKVLDWNWQRDCMGDPEQEAAYLMLLQRGWDGVMMPGFDIIRHRDGKWTNSDHTSTTDGSTNVVVTATRDIVEAEEIFTSYNQCDNCGNRKTTYGTPQFLRDQGTIDQLPQRWILEDDVVFEVANVEGSDRLKIIWLDGELPDEEDLFFLEAQFARLELLA